MDSDSKRQKSSEEEDRISNLPTCLISHILSLLPTKYAVRTSTLSTFWNQQWTSITQLRFDDALAPDTSSTPETKASFVKFVYRVLLHLKVASPDVFQLKCHQGDGVTVTHVNSWLSAALSRNVQHIDLSIPMDVPGLLPRSLFSRRKLVVLKLGTGFLLKVPVSVSLDSLKILHLAVNFSDNDSLSRLLSSCPMLEELNMQGNIGNNVTRVNISSTTLKRLILISLDPRSEPRLNIFRIIVNTPGLQYLEYTDCRVPDYCSMETLHCLDIARIDMAVQLGKYPTLQDKRVRLAILSRSIRSLVVGISSVKSLYLSKNACQLALVFMRSGSPDSGLPKFPRLIELELDGTYSTILEAFLESSPELATISFQYSYACNDRLYKDEVLYPPSSVAPSCLLSNLKKIEIKNFRGHQMELGIASFFLEKSKCLSKLLISYSSGITTKDEAEISKKLLMLPRASTSCIVVIT